VGEIGYLTSIAKPDVAIVNNVGPAHLEGFGSLENIAKAKAEIYNGLSENGVAIINRDDVFSDFWVDYCASHCAAQRVISFSMQDETADVYAAVMEHDRVLVTADGDQAELKLKVPGKHNVMNALAAVSATMSVGVPLKSIVTSLSDFENIRGRLTVIESAAGFRVIDDAYNANPKSVSAAIDVLASMPGDTVLVLGDMAELGEDAARLHALIGEKAKQAGIDKLFATGEYSRNTVKAFGADGYWYQNKSELINDLKESLKGTETVLIKGSRSAVMEEVVEQILTQNNNKRVV
jgi:UDP-N-acetylmuramoyl-tripeptide--D-alanyl-D-alanine ligase